MIIVAGVVAITAPAIATSAQSVAVITSWPLVADCVTPAAVAS